MTKEQRKAARERAEKATKGPWRESQTGFPCAKVTVDIDNPDGSSPICSLNNRTRKGAGMANRAFIAHARTDLPAALSELDRLYRCQECGGEGGGWIDGPGTVFVKCGACNGKGERDPLAEIDRLRKELECAK